MKRRGSQKRGRGRPSKGPTQVFNMKMPIGVAGDVNGYMKIHRALVKNKTKLVEMALVRFMEELNTPELLAEFVREYKERKVRQKTIPFKSVA